VWSISNAAKRFLNFFTRGYAFKGETAYPVLYGQTSSSGASVSEETSLRLSTVWACVHNKACDIAKLPITIIRSEGNSRVIASEHDQYHILKSDPSPLMTGYSYRKAMTLFHELWGAAFAEIIRNSATGRPIAYRIMHPGYVEDVQIKINGVTELFWKDTESGRLIPDNDVIKYMMYTYDGINYKSPTRVFRDTIGSGITQGDMASELYANGLRSDGYIKTQTPKNTREQSEALADNFAKSMSNWDIPVLDGNSEFKEFGMPLTDAQFIENRKFSVAEICRIWRMPLHKVNQLDNAIKSNIQEQSQEYIDDSLLPLIVCMEQEHNRKIFRSSERGRYSFKIEIKGLLRGDPVKRAALYDSMFGNSAMTPDEMRAREDMNPLPEGMHGNETFTRVDTLPTSMVMAYHAAKNIN